MVFEWLRAQSKDTSGQILRVMEAAKIDIISRELVKPSSPTPADRKLLLLSFVDQFWPHKFVPLLSFYQNHPPEPDNSYSKPLDPSQTTQNLKQSLSQILSKFYPLAGKLNEGLLSVDCDDSGALFVEAKVDVPLTQTVVQNAPYECYGKFLPFEPILDVVDGKILDTYPENEIILAVQITWFECGGNAVGVCISHRVSDCLSFVTFLNSWAAENRGERAKSSLNFDLGRQLFPPGDSPFRFPAAAQGVKRKIGCKRFLISKEKLKELKSMAISSSVKNPTRVEVVTAFLMKQFVEMARAKNRGDAAKTIFKMRHVVNFRNRIHSLSSSNDDDEFAFGNFGVQTIAAFSDDENEEHFRGYGDLVSLTSSAIRKVDSDYFAKFVVPFTNYLSIDSGIEALQQEQEQIIMQVHFTSWCRFATYEVDFGWGKPVSVGSAGTLDATRVVLTSSPNEEAIEAWIYWFEDEFALLPDELLSLEPTQCFDLNRTHDQLSF